MFKCTGIDHVAVNTNDMEATLQFYCGTLGMRLARLERFGLLILIGIIFILPMIAGQLGIQFNLLAIVIGIPVELLIQIITTLTGLV